MSLAAVPVADVDLEGLASSVAARAAGVFGSSGATTATGARLRASSRAITVSTSIIASLP